MDNHITLTSNNDTRAFTPTNLIQVNLSPPQWQPIETAPKDGSYIIVNNPEMKCSRDVMIVHWLDNVWESSENDNNKKIIKTVDSQNLL